MRGCLGSALTLSGSATALAVLGAGLLISGAWLLITVLAQSVLRRHAIAGAFASPSFKHLPNPLAESIWNRTHTQTYHLILLVIVVFALMYLGLGYIRLVSG